MVEKDPIGGHSPLHVNLVRHDWVDAGQNGTGAMTDWADSNRQNTSKQEEETNDREQLTHSLEEMENDKEQLTDSLDDSTAFGGMDCNNNNNNNGCMCEDFWCSEWR